MKLEWRPDSYEGCCEALSVNGKYFGMVCSTTNGYSCDTIKGFADSLEAAKRFLMDEAWRMTWPEVE